MSTLAGSVATVRPATSADAGKIRRLDGLAAVNARLVAHDLGADDRRCLVAVVGAGGGAAGTDDEVVGYAALAVQSDTAEVLDLVVASAWRRRGAADRLVAALLDLAAGAGVDDVALEVAVGNRPARALYRRHGFVAEGRRTRYYPDGQDALVLWRRGRASEEDGRAGTRHRDLL